MLSQSPPQTGMVWWYGVVVWYHHSKTVLWKSQAWYSSMSCTHLRNSQLSDYYPPCLCVTTTMVLCRGPGLQDNDEQLKRMFCLGWKVLVGNTVRLYAHSGVLSKGIYPTYIAANIPLPPRYQSCWTVVYQASITFSLVASSRSRTYRWIVDRRHNNHRRPSLRLTG